MTRSRRPYPSSRRSPLFVAPRGQSSSPCREALRSRADVCLFRRARSSRTLESCSPLAYRTLVMAGACVCAVLCASARRHPGRWTVTAAAAIGLVLAADAVTYTVSLIVRGTWSAETSLPLALCSVAVPIAAAACLSRNRLLVELTYFRGLTGTLPAVLTPDLDVVFPHRVFFEYVIVTSHRRRRALPCRRTAPVSAPRRSASRLRRRTTYALVRWPGRLGERRQLHVPAQPTIQLDTAATRRSVAIVHRKRSSPSHAITRSPRHAPLAPA